MATIFDSTGTSRNPCRSICVVGMMIHHWLVTAIGRYWDTAVRALNTVIWQIIITVVETCNCYDWTGLAWHKPCLKKIIWYPSWIWWEKKIVEEKAFTRLFLWWDVGSLRSYLEKGHEKRKHGRVMKLQSTLVCTTHALLPTSASFPRCFQRVHSHPNPRQTPLPTRPQPQER